ncbi:uncharacterized protein BXZ73DRAFT_51535 [Epithele typhae]|uniref:uncharacterized protein n=1 Tax=Epithele typhae TaxID=378194 RepID=UPI002007B854|nr:uncharacterized protein BXZ73DRAFT_51535 [Epithele typhae]KAH9921996.1 hypothetical protein BXZ73DRAFT_51535 [Epithele typhae]
MASEVLTHDIAPSHSLAGGQPIAPLTNGVKRSFTHLDEDKYWDPSFMSLPSCDTDSYYYPHAVKTEDGDLPASTYGGNWGSKTLNHAKWVRRGKMTAWGPWMEDWESEDRARKRLKQMLATEEEQDGPLTLSHLRSPSPPLTAPYPHPNTQHLSYTSFVMDKATTHSFRSRVFDELEDSTNTLIEGESTLRRALGRLWQVMNESPQEDEDTRGSVIPKREDEDGDPHESDNRFARAPDLTPAVNKLFLSTDQQPPIFEHSRTRMDMQMDALEKSLATLRELQDDGREYGERLEEIREGLGEVRTQRGGVWDLVRRKAIQELQEAASLTATGVS